MRNEQRTSKYDDSWQGIKEGLNNEFLQKKKHIYPSSHKDDYFNEKAKDHYNKLYYQRSKSNANSQYSRMDTKNSNYGNFSRMGSKTSNMGNNSNISKHFIQHKIMNLVAKNNDLNSKKKISKYSTNQKIIEKKDNSDNKSCNSHCSINNIGPDGVPDLQSPVFNDNINSSKELHGDDNDENKGSKHSSEKDIIAKLKIKNQESLNDRKLIQKRMSELQSHKSKIPHSGLQNHFPQKNIVNVNETPN